MKRSYSVVDVFSSRPLLGNPVAVVMEAEELTADAMQAIARWTNLSETTFVLPPTTADADYRLKIFTPRSELPFAGHPTPGSAHALLEAGRIVPRGSEPCPTAGRSDKAPSDASSPGHASLAGR
jgi:PhzF family phenazine biosynthesis protein